MVTDYGAQVDIVHAPENIAVHKFAFLAKLCRNIACNKLDWMHAEKRRAEILPLTDELSACIPDRAAERRTDAEELGAALSAFLKTLSQEARVIFLRRYWYMDSVKEIAERYQMGESKVKTTLFRTREKLRAFLEKEEICI